MVRSMLIPISAAASRSCAVARIALPSLVRWMKAARPSISGMATPITIRSLVLKRTVVCRCRVRSAARGLNSNAEATAVTITVNMAAGRIRRNLRA